MSVAFERQWRYQRRRLMKGVLGYAVVAGAVIAMSVFGLQASLNEEAPDAFSLRSGILLCAAALVTWHAASVLIQFFSRKPRIVPYFNKRLNTQRETGEAFRAGYRIAGDLDRLDAMAAELGVAPISTFGFSDDVYGQPLLWYSPAEALRTTTELIGRLTSGAAERADASALIMDLEKLASVLRKALATDASFCLVLRDGDDKYISPTEMDRRHGSFW